ncbi:hypothetical protein ASPSYDRAFT_39395 [Aspergillus sydowii CBS 593.65]|uniref:Uncharacterized protein n=1 Tax=Aspergillus sydowii CBS 593.65 TaxID=1036612 RepID=A0A1L9TYZ2_9EURO|nr:uncharacterized protein ASPSYDRAFT_39395 [Aspergillus sydowii CBS 593.65]OJJ64654.1 hypothetical protein ASPSYDRAFT_39395 [Aspergillus sydowii CBS 593.65]
MPDPSSNQTTLLQKHRPRRALNYCRTPAPIKLATLRSQLIGGSRFWQFSSFPLWPFSEGRRCAISRHSPGFTLSSCTIQQAPELVMPALSGFAPVIICKIREREKVGQYGSLPFTHSFVALCTRAPSGV